MHKFDKAARGAGWIFALPMFAAQAALWLCLDRSAGPWILSVAGAVALLLIFACRRAHGAVWGILFLQFVGIAYAGFTIPTGPWRLPVAALVLFYIGAALSWTIVRLGWTKMPHAMLLSASVLGSLFAIEVGWEFKPLLPSSLGTMALFRTLQSGSDRPVMAGNGYNSDPALGSVPRPYGRQAMFFPTNPRGYFLQADPERESWGLVTHNGKHAVLQFSQSGDLVRIEIWKFKSGQPWEINLSRERLAVEGGREYVLRFNVRADRERKINVRLAEDGPPPSDKGSYREFTVGPQWQHIEARFAIRGRNGQARLSFELGGDSASIDLSELRLEREETGELVPPFIPAKYYLPVEQNDHGCRARDYAVPRPEYTFRILALGNSASFGWGVKYEDLFTSVLESRLNGQTSRDATGWRYEVINCAVPAYGSAQERRFYETMLADYRPQIVLLMTAATDNKVVADRANDAETAKPYPWERIFLTPYLFRLRSHARKLEESDYGPAAAEVLSLAKVLERDGARLVVAEFQMVPANLGSPEYLKWGRNPSPWFNVLSRTLKDTHSTFVDLAPVMYDGRQADDLMVYPGDPHQNEIAHRAAGLELVRVLEENGLLPRREEWKPNN